MGQYIVIVDFRLRPGAFDRFRDIIVENAKASLEDEPGCRRFDVVVPEGAADRIMLYEIYDDAAAFAEHVKTAHYAAFARDSQPLVAAKTVTLGRLELGDVGAPRPAPKASKPRTARKTR